MKEILAKFLKRLIIYTLTVGIISLIATLLVPKQMVNPSIPWIILFFAVITFITFYAALKAFTKRTARYANFFMVSVFAKLLLYVAIILIYAFINIGNIISFIVTFFIYYLLFTLFETIEIVKAQKLQK